MRKEPGLSLAEILIVFGLVLVLMGMTAVISTSSIRNSEFDRVVDTLRGELFAAQADTIAGTHDSAWGIRFATNTIIRFKGDSYATRDFDYDRMTIFNNEVAISGAQEIVFTRPYGAPDVVGEIYLNNGFRYATATINALGAIQIQ